MEEKKAKLEYETQMNVVMGVTGVHTCDFFLYCNDTVFLGVPHSFQPSKFNTFVSSMEALFERYLFSALNAEVV